MKFEYHNYIKIIHRTLQEKLTIDGKYDTKYKFRNNKHQKIN